LSSRPRPLAGSCLQKPCKHEVIFIQYIAHIPWPILDNQLEEHTQKKLATYLDLIRNAKMSAELPKGQLHGVPAFVDRQIGIDGVELVFRCRIEDKAMVHPCPRLHDLPYG
jgi:hypothetical protein